MSKRELLADYYPDELPVLLREWRRLREPPADEPPADAMDFFGEGGERL